MKKIIILTASFGMGHNSVSSAIKQDLENKKELDISIEIIDFFREIHPLSSSFFEKSYRILSQNFPRVYNFFYKKKNKKKSFIEEFLFLIDYLKVKRIINKKKPDYIISTFPLCSGYISKVKKDIKKSFKLMTVITDIIEGWEWIHENTDYYCVPSIEVKEHLIKSTVPSKKIFIGGIPVHEKFKKNISNKSDKKRILIMSNILYLIDNPIDFINDINIKMEEKIDEILIITGNDKAMYRRLNKLSLQKLLIMGYTNDIEKYIRNSDIVISKPGGVTLFETINLETPIVTCGTSFGQEQGNINFIKNRGIGKVFINQKEILDYLDYYFSNDFEKKSKKDSIINLKNSFKLEEFYEILN